jgi:hypothetical protein
MGRFRAIVAALALAVPSSIVVAGWTLPSPGLLSTTSFMNAPLAGNAPLDPRSPQLVAALNAEIRSEEAAVIGPWIGTAGTSLYIVPENQPRVPVRLDTGSWGDTLKAILAQGVPIPPGAQPAVGSDATMAIWQPSTDTLWDFWVANVQSDGWHAQWGGRMLNVSSNPGYFLDRRDASGAIVEQSNWGSAATSIPMAAGVPTIAEMRTGHIDHGLALDLPAPCKEYFSWPAQRTDGTSKDANCMPEGARLRIDPNLDLSTLSLPPFTRMLAVAAQKYGIVVRNRTGHATGFGVEDAAGGPDPYYGPSGLFGGYGQWDLAKAFPWDHLQLLPLNSCTATPCGARPDWVPGH